MADAYRLPVYRNGEVIAWALIDEADAPLVTHHRWYLKSDNVVYRREGPRSARRAVFLHRQIMGLSADASRDGKRLEVDHINRDRLDNRRVNLRVCTGRENSQNVPARGGTSKHRGVSWCPNRGMWQAIVVLDYRLNRLGYFEDEEEAARVAAAYRARHMPFSQDAALAAA